MDKPHILLQATLVSGAFSIRLMSFFYFSVITLGLMFSTVKADDIEYTNVQQNNADLQISWDVFGQRWHALVSRDSYLGDDITVVDVSFLTGNEVLNRIMPNCYYRGTLTDEFFNPIDNTYAYFNLCDMPALFTGFVSDSNSVYVIEESNTSPTGIAMTIDNPNLDVPYLGISLEGGTANNLPDGKYPRHSRPALFPSLEIVVEPAYVAKFEGTRYFDRIIENLAFTNFIYQQSGLKQITLISIGLLDVNIIWSGGSGSVMSNLHGLRMRTAQPTSADMMIAYLGSHINTTNVWGWADEGYACDLQRAVAEGLNVNTVNIGKSSGYVIDLPSLIQRGWIKAHEIGHILNVKHIRDDPLMDGRFQLLPFLSGYQTGCAVKQLMYESCKFNQKNWKFTDFYSCD